MAQLNVHNRTDGLQELVPLSGQLDSWIQTSIVYAVEGAVIAAVSLPYVIVVALCSTLREQKEYVIFAALSFAYSLFGIGYMIAGIVRSIVLFNGNDITSMIGVAPTSNYFYYVLPQVSGMVNSIIYTLRYKDLRAATVDLFTCRFQMAPQQKRTTVQAVSFNKAPSGSGLKS
uniref:Uncharacterized protein n=1 Tax=Plectus sambesii TaxID=2011161 RepID=A0A914V0Z5_9BILA